MAMIETNPPQRKAGIAWTILRKGFAATRWLSPKTPALRQLALGDFKVLCWINERLGRRLMLARSFEADDIEALKRLIRPGDMIADVGANIGYISLYMSKFAGPQGRVYSFEPMSHLHPVVTLNAWMNAITNISVHPLVITDKSDARAVAHMPLGEPEFAYFTVADAGEGMRTQRLDDFAASAGIERFDVIKIDVEGGEVGVLKGASKLLGDARRRPRVLMVEIANEQLRRFGYQLEDVYDLLLPNGYKAFTFQRGSFKAVSSPREADLWNVFFTTEPVSNDRS